MTLPPGTQRLRRYAVITAAIATVVATGSLAYAAQATTKSADDPAALTIHALLGPGHLSPYAGQQVSDIGGVVTDVTSTDFYLQDPANVGGTPFKQAIDVYVGKKPTVVAGDDVTVSGEVTEYYPDQSDTPSALPVAEIEHPTVTIVSAGNPLPAPVVIGSSGVLPPTQEIYPYQGGNSTDLTTVTSFRPFSSADDFYFGLYSEYVEVQDPIAVGPTNDFAFAVAPDNGAGALRTAAGGLADVSNFTVNSRRLSVYAPDGVNAPNVDTGDHFSSPVIGIMNEYEGNPELDLTQTPGVVSSGLTRQVAKPAEPGELTVATYNLDNLSPSASAAKWAALGSEITTNLGAPDILAVQEIQDNDGETDDGVVDATVTLNDLVAAIKNAGGPAYSWTEIDPVNDQDGGAPGGNIRQVILYRTDTGLTFDSIPGGGSTVADSVTGHGATTALAQSPGRIDPNNPAWVGTETLTSPMTTRTELSSDSRKPLAAQFTWKGHTIFVINNHLTAKLADDADFGRYQRPVQWSEIQRVQQGQILNGFVTSVEKADPGAYVIVLGDMNDDGFSPAFQAMEAHGALIDTERSLPKTQQYDYVFDGDSEELSGLLASPALYRFVTFAGPVHINADFYAQTSDHDPLLTYFNIPSTR
jgi:predicted extracellular nuclease